MSEQQILVHRVTELHVSYEADKPQVNVGFKVGPEDFRYYGVASPLASAQLALAILQKVAEKHQQEVADAPVLTLDSIRKMGTVNPGAFAASPIDGKVVLVARLAPGVAIPFGLDVEAAEKLLPVLQQVIDEAKSGKPRPN